MWVISGRWGCWSRPRSGERIGACSGNSAEAAVSERSVRRQRVRALWRGADRLAGSVRDYGSERFAVAPLPRRDERIVIVLIIQHCHAVADGLAVGLVLGSPEAIDCARSFLSGHDGLLWRATLSRRMPAGPRRRRSLASHGSAVSWRVCPARNVRPRVAQLVGCRSPNWRELHDIDTKG